MLVSVDVERFWRHVPFSRSRGRDRLLLNTTAPHGLGNVVGLFGVDSWRWIGPRLLPLRLFCEDNTKIILHCLLFTLWFQLEDMFQLIGTPQGIEHVMVQFKDMPQGFKKYRVKYKA